VSLRALLVEDDRTLRTLVHDALQNDGLDVTTAEDGERARELVFSRHFDLVILDLMLPRRGGLEVLRELRERRQSVPVLVLTARGDESDKVLGLELGADDYLTKPFGLRELIARVHALLRRRARPLEAGNGKFRLGGAEVDLSTFEVRRGRRCVALLPKEARILALLFAESGRVVERRRVLDEVWGGDAFVNERTLDTHVLNLRKKIEKDPRAPRYLRTVHGVGYRLVVEGEAE
jgi:two-component system alkaline phosphatase synthesis response regulator PhoP